MYWLAFIGQVRFTAAHSPFGHSQPPMITAPSDFFTHYNYAATDDVTHELLKKVKRWLLQ